jgi:dTDP-4-dehydrorhamnose reductase
MNILLTGRNGQVGWELERILAPFGDIAAFDRRSLDIADPDAIRERVREVRPAIIVNAAAYTAVDKAESEREAAQAANARAPQVMADEAKRLGALLVHYSTDYVFDGEKPEPYTEEDPINPVSAYGASKAAGEEAIRQSGCRHVILRTCWVYGARGGNFMLTMLRLARERREISVVNDQWGSPTWCRTIARATLALLERPQAAEEARLLHLACSGYTTWFDFASAIIAKTASIRERQPLVRPIASSEYPTAARRPSNSRLSTARIAGLLGAPLPDWRSSLDECLAGYAP